MVSEAPSMLSHPACTLVTEEREHLIRMPVQNLLPIVTSSSQWLHPVAQYGRPGQTLQSCQQRSVASIAYAGQLDQLQLQPKNLQARV